jgi:dihydrofolate synthase/folylpolyglutamate synthase
LDYLYSLRNQGSSFGLERMSAFASVLGRPDESYPVVHVAGTNGKGSVCSMLDSLYRANGYKVGLFTSPHLVELGERVRVNGKPISPGEIKSMTVDLRSMAACLEKKNPGLHPTFFEFMTAMAFVKFKEAEVDLAIVETGLGGRLDSTNIVIPELSVITTISRDHCSILGHEIEQIAREKAGIVKPGKPVLTGWLEPVANQVVEQVARELEAPFETMASSGLREDELPKTNLHGAYQRRNAAMAERAAGLLSSAFPIEPKKTARGLGQVRLEGRWQVIPGPPRIILDACHNAEGARALKGNLATLDRKVEVWFGSLGEDRAGEVLEEILPFAHSLRLFQPRQPRACSLDALLEMIPQDFRGTVSKGEAGKVSEYLASEGEDRIILVTGSLYLIGEILGFVKNSREGWGDELQDIT